MSTLQPLDIVAQLKYLHLEGQPGKFNHLLYHQPLRRLEVITEEVRQRPPPPPDIVCFFGGDIQNFRAQMSPEHQRYIENYCLESVVVKLSGRFPHSAIVAVQPVTQYQQTFSRYTNFLRIVDQLGTPEYVTSVDAALHLDALISAVADSEELITSKDNQLQVALIGFSKGGTVLNQLLYSLHASRAFWRNCEPQTSLKSTQLRTRITDFYFLDTGHNGLNGVWINESAVVESLASYAQNHHHHPIHIHIGMTAFQLEYKNERWIAREEAEFGNLVRKYSVEKESGKELLKLSRIYLGGDDKNPKKDDYLQLHFSIIDRLVEGKL